MDGRVEQWTTNSSDETVALGVEIGRRLKADQVVCFYGDLGAGKTTLIKGIASGFTGCDLDEVDSPTFVYLNVYEGSRPLFHFDLYRLSQEQFVAMGFEEYFEGGGVCCVEWADKIEKLLPSGCISLTLKHLGENKREITLVQ